MPDTAGRSRLTTDATDGHSMPLKRTLSHSPLLLDGVSGGNDAFCPKVPETSSIDEVYPPRSIAVSNNQGGDLLA